MTSLTWALRLVAADAPGGVVADSAISYQGRLVNGGAPASGSFDFVFTLRDAASGGNSVGEPLRRTLTVNGGVFSASLDFPAASFTGAARWVEVRVRPTPAGGSEVPDSESPFAVLERQRIQSVPYAFRAVAAASAATVESVPVTSLPTEVPLLNGEGKLGVAQIPDEIARVAAVTALEAQQTAAVAALRTDLDQLTTLLTAATARVTALEQENTTLRQSVQTLSAPARSGWMAASFLAADPDLVQGGFTVVSSIAAPAWTAPATVGAPSARFAGASVWTGQEWILWGGKIGGQTLSGTGARYRPDLDSWTEVTPIDAPSARTGHTAVWTDTEMIVWGGFSDRALNTGARFTPAPQGWMPVSTEGAPSARSGHGAVWTGRSMLVFGGKNASGLLGDGGLYDPVTDTWTALPTQGAPAPRTGATVIWTGSELLIWGGDEDEAAEFATGARLSFSTAGQPGTWQAIPVLEGFSVRSGHAGVWDGRRLIVWGGRTRSGTPLSDGAVWDSTTGQWTTMGTSGAPTPRFDVQAVWTGEELALFGGANYQGPLSTGAAWRRDTGTWRALPGLPTSSARTGAFSAWTGTTWLLFGGFSANSAPISDPQRIEVRPPWYLYRRSGIPADPQPTPSP
ncbi:MAG: hypothetical protein RLZ45_2834 [Verrucomicrobiota bacterium]